MTAAAATLDPKQDTKERILDAAERLFSEQGLAATSLRSIITAAGVNLAAIHYHFRSKDALIEAVLLRRFGPVNRERLVLLDRAVAEAAPAPPTVEAILTAFVEPTIAVASDPAKGGRLFVRLMGRMFTEGADLWLELLRKHGSQLSQRFANEIQRALPDRDPRDLYWDMFFAVGVMAHTLQNMIKIETLSNGLCAIDDPADVTRRMVAFAAAGLKRT